MKKGREQRISAIDEQIRKIHYKVLRLNYQLQELQQAKTRILQGKPTVGKMVLDRKEQSKKDRQSYLADLEDYLFEVSKNDRYTEILDSQIRRDLEPLLLDEQK